MMAIAAMVLSKVVRIGLGALMALLVVALPSAAHAAGTVQIKNTQPEEADGRWKLNMTINYGATPHLAHIPMIFAFEHTVHYERALTDKSGDKPVLVKQPLSNQQPINESMDVGFSDGTGKVFNITKFDFVVRRDRGFEAGEYTLKIKRAGDGVAVGTPQKIVLKGDNPIVDRRAIVFSGEKKSKQQEGGGDKAGSGEKKDDAADGEKKEPETPDPTPADRDPSPETDTPVGPPPEAPKQGGCGCRLADTGAPSPIAALLLGLGAVAARWRRGRRTTALRPG